MGMELRQLKCFFTAATLLNMTKAADRLNISQPALSISIKRLEEELGTKLFDREGHYISLTESGRSILPMVSQMLDKEQDVMDFCRNGNKDKKDLYIHNDASQPFIVECASRFHHDHPDFSIHFINDESSEKRADIIISGSSEMPEKTRGCGNEIIFMEKMQVAVPRIIRPVYESPVTLEYILDNDLIGLNEKNSLGRIERDFFKKNGISLSHSITCDNSSIMRNLLMNGTGLAFVPEKT